MSDPVSEFYRSVFDSQVVLDPDIADAKVRTELRADHLKRLNHEIPPGYEDETKSDQGIGDRLIWETILLLARSRKQPLAFVTMETKLDWVHCSKNGINAGPRYELIDEYRRASEGKGFYVIRLADLLELFDADPKRITEIKKAEDESAASSRPDVVPAVDPLEWMDRMSYGEIVYTDPSRIPDDLFQQFLSKAAFRRAQEQASGSSARSEGAPYLGQNDLQRLTDIGRGWGAFQTRFAAAANRRGLQAYFQ